MQARENTINAVRTVQTKQRIMVAKCIENVLLTASEDQKLRMWEILQANREQQRVYTGELSLAHNFAGQKGVPESLSNFRNLLYTSSTRDIHLRTWDLQTCQCGPAFAGHTQPLTDVSTDQRAEVPSVWSSSYDKTVKGWDGKCGDCVATLTGHTDTVTSLKISGNYVVSSSCDKSVRIWDKRKLEACSVLQVHTGPVHGLKIVNEKTLLSVGSDGVVCWKLKTGEQKWKVEPGYPVLKMKSHKKHLTTMGTNAIDVYNIKGKKVETLQGGHTGNILVHKFYDDDYLFSGSADRTVRLWHVKSGKQMAVLRGHQSHLTGIQFFGKWLYTTGDDGGIRQWENPVFNGIDEGERWM